MKKILFISFILFIQQSSINIQQCFAQISQGGIPPSFLYKSISDSFEIREFPKPDLDKIAIEDGENEKSGTPYRYAVSIPVNLNIENSGTWTNLPDGSRIWRLKLKSSDALALGVYYDNFWLPPKGKLYLYDEDRTQVIGAFTEFNNHESDLFATELIKGETVILEYFEPCHSERSEESNSDEPAKAIISISEIAHAYRGVNFYLKNIKSDWCEVDVICSPEGDNWQDEKRGVARISIKIGGDYFLCSGSLVNNVHQDCSPYFLTADHCAYYGGYASADDLTQWIFYFNEEASTCSGTTSGYNTITGATFKAKSGGGGGGSDFYFILLNHYIPVSYAPYYNGWNRINSASPSGVSIHPPDGDIKKISNELKSDVSINETTGPPLENET